MKYRVTSETDKTKQYIVQHFEEADKWVCECPAYSFSKLGGECKHIRKVKAFLASKGGVKA